jgi:7-cyano-7-deazaguanine synthase
VTMAGGTKRGGKAPAVVLLSGGLDSATCLAWGRERGFECHALTVDYGQRHRAELDAARRVAASLGAASHRVIAVDLRAIGGSALTADLEVPRDRAEAAIAAGIPVTYVPARNTVLLALALGLAERLAARDLVAGMNAIDYSGYPDCRPEFVRAFEDLAKLATRAGVEGASFIVHTPLMALDKAGIVRLGATLGVDFALTHSCYDPAPDGAACGRCDACRLRLKGFRAAGLADPVRYAVARSI